MPRMSSDSIDLEGERNVWKICVFIVCRIDPFVDNREFIQSATLDGKPLNKPWFYHWQLADGGKLVLQMGPEPNKKWGSTPGAAPPSMTKQGK